MLSAHNRAQSWRRVSPQKREPAPRPALGFCSLLSSMTFPFMSNLPGTMQLPKRSLRWSATGQQKHHRGESLQPGTAQPRAISQPLPEQHRGAAAALRLLRPGLTRADPHYSRVPSRGVFHVKLTFWNASPIIPNKSFPIR